MSHKQEAPRPQIAAHAIDELLLGGTIEINYYVPTEDNIHLIKLGILAIHQIEPVKDYFFSKSRFYPDLPLLLFLAPQYIFRLDA